MRLVADIGGTNIRFALVPEGSSEPQQEVSMLCADFRGLEEAARRYLSTVGVPSVSEAAFDVATAVTGDFIKLTNSPWAFSIEQTRRVLGLTRLVVINDFTALALALPDLAPRELRQLGGGTAVAAAPLALIGPGTGLGVSGLLPGAAPGQWVPLQGEGGHVSLAAANRREADVLQALRDTFGHASAERAVSGQGLEALHAAIGRLDSLPTRTSLSAAEISRRALAGSDARCVEVLDLFCGFLGNVAGNLALTLGARGGVYIGGGIVPRLGDAFMRSRFRACFEDKGRFRAYLEAIPVFVIHADVSPALLGAARAL